MNGMIQEVAMGMDHQIKLKMGSYLSRDVVVRSIVKENFIVIFFYTCLEIINR